MRWLLGRFIRLVPAVMLLVLSPCLIHAEPAGEKLDAGELRQLAFANKVWTGDFETMFERRAIRVLVPYSRTLYFNDKGHEYGVTADTVRGFERFLNKKYKKKLGKRPLTVYIIPTTRDKLLSGVADGLGDIAAANLTVTEERRKLVDFATSDDLAIATEVVVTATDGVDMSKLTDLAGKKVHVRKSSSYHESLLTLNERLQGEGLPPVEVTLVPDALEDEDMMEMVNAGLMQIIVVDDWKAKMWAQVLPNIKVREDLPLRTGGRVGWAIRKESPQLEKEILDYYHTDIKKLGAFSNRWSQYMKRIKQIRNNGQGEEAKRFQQTMAIFEKYSLQYNFDPLMLAAQGFQESRLDQNARSHVGAVGVMQVMPTTGAELKVGDILKVEPNIHAGAKYLDKLMTKYFVDVNFSDNNRTLFAFASYNAGPGNVARMRKLARERGLDPDKWFNNVELVMAEKVGMEPTTYVRNIFKYYVAYKMMVEQKEEARKAREQLEAGAGK